MRTPGHAVLNLAALALLSDGADAHAVAVVAGAVVPDLPIVALYLVERARGTPEAAIWTGAYRRPAWQAAVHWSHSIPVAAVGAALAFATGHAAVALFFASALLHSLADIPVHAEDAHRHFLPFSDWRWQSPLSYWDVRHHARVVALVEAVLVTAAAIFVGRHASPLARVGLVLVCAWYATGYVRTFRLRGGTWDPYF